MKKIPPHIAAFLVLAFAACTDDYEQIGQNGIQVIGSFSTTDSRTTYTEDDTSVSTSWATGDVIYLMSETDTTPLKYKATSDGETIEFEPVGNAIVGTEGEKYYAWYPYTSNSDSVVEYPSATLPDIYDQSYNDGTIPASKDFLYASRKVSDNTLTLKFSHFFAFLRITIDPDLLEGTGFYIISSVDPISYSAGTGYISVSDNGNGVTYWPGTTTLNNPLYSIQYNIDADDMASADMLTCYVAMLPISDSSGTIGIYQKVTNESTNSTSVGSLIWEKDNVWSNRGHVYTVTVSESQLSAKQETYRQALTALYNATDGTNWTNNENWCTDADISTWYGVTTSSGLVTGLSLANNNLVGTIPDEIGDLDKLQTLDLSNNELTGSIPTTICNLTNLTYLALQNNELTGIIPSQIPILTNLTKLLLYRVH